MLKKPQPFITILLIFISFFLLLFTYSTPPVFSNSLFQLEKEIKEKEKEIEQKENILNNVERRIKEINGSNYSISQKVQLLSEEMDVLGESIEKKEEETEKQIVVIDNKKKQLKETKILIDDISGELYIQSRYKIVSFFMNENNWGNIMEGIFIKKSMLSILRSRIEKMGGEFSSLTESKADLDREMKRLKKQKEDLNEAYKMLEDEKVRLQAELSKQMASRSGLSAEIGGIKKELSELQSYLLAVRSGGNIANANSLVSTNSLGSYANFSRVAPSGTFGIFSYGAFTHRNGMSQWGARARADAGQSMSQILSFYYPGTNIRNGSVVIGGTKENITKNISVDDYGSVNFEEYYLMGIKEVPEDWPMEVLKAQAIAARTFAIKHTNNGRGSICTSQSCQVFNLPLKTGRWKEAVIATKGMVLVDGNGSPVSTQYAAVHGGWVNNAGWDTESGGGGNWFYDAWERKSEVTWFYKSWYRAGYTSGGESCGRGPWISHEEMVIFINAYFVKNDIGLKTTPDKSRILPSDYGRCSGRLDYGRSDKTPYSSNDLKNLLVTPVNSVYSVSTSLVNGTATNVSFSTDIGVVNMSGLNFKNIYNQIAPGHMRIQQQSHYAYFNVEKR